jgi:hypothetical protein
LDCVARLRGRPQEAMNLIPAIKQTITVGIAVPSPSELAALPSMFDL